MRFCTTAHAPIPQFALQAAAPHKSVSEIGLETALSEASERLADQTSFPLDEKNGDAFLKSFDAPPRRQARLKSLFHEPFCWRRIALANPTSPTALIRPTMTIRCAHNERTSPIRAPSTLPHAAKLSG